MILTMLCYHIKLIIYICVPFCFTGGTLKIYAHTVFPEVPYKTLLVSVDETCDEIIQESLEKFGKEKANPKEYVLVKVRIVSISLFSAKNVYHELL